MDEYSIINTDWTLINIEKEYNKLESGYYNDMIIKENKFNKNNYYLPNTTLYKLNNELEKNKIYIYIILFVIFIIIYYLL